MTKEILANQIKAVSKAYYPDALDINCMVSDNGQTDLEIIYPSKIIKWRYKDGREETSCEEKTSNQKESRND